MHEVAGVIEREVALELVDVGVVALPAHFGEPLQRTVQAIHVGLMMAPVVQLEELCGIGGRERVVCVSEWR